VGCGDFDAGHYGPGRIGDDTGQSTAVSLSKAKRNAETDNQHELRQLSHTGASVLGSEFGETQRGRRLIDQRSLSPVGNPPLNDLYTWVKALSMKKWDIPAFISTFSHASPWRICGNKPHSSDGS
jgi:hypothetical protein